MTPSRSAVAQRAARGRAPQSLLKALLLTPGLGACLAAALVGGVGFYGALRGGEYADFVAKQGQVQDVLAKAAGFGIEAVTIAGERELTEPEILTAAGISPRNSLLFLDVDAVRNRLKDVPLVNNVSISKLYPNRLLIEVEERQPFALWQKDGQVQIVAADGTPIDELRDERFANLPLVVGAGANERLSEFMAILEAAGDLKASIRAGILVAGRRWNLKMTDGLDIALPEVDPRGALVGLMQMQRDKHLLNKAVLSLDLRQAGRIVARLTDEAAAARAEALPHKKPKGGTT